MKYFLLQLYIQVIRIVKQVSQYHPLVYTGRKCSLSHKCSHVQHTHTYTQVSVPFLLTLFAYSHVVQRPKFPS